MHKFDPRLAKSKAVKLNRSELSRVIKAFTERGPSQGEKAWERACVKGIRKGKLDAASVDQCIAHVKQEVERENDKAAAADHTDKKVLTPHQVKKIPSKLKMIAEKFT